MLFLFVGAISALTIKIKEERTDVKMEMPIE